MKKQKLLILEGKGLKINDLHNLISNDSLKVSIGNRALKFVQANRKFLEQELKKDRKIFYGVNTGFGPMADHILSNDNLKNLQKNLINSHAVGMGQPIDPLFVLAALTIRLNTLLKGYSGVTPGLLHSLTAFINLRLLPLVPEHGAVGTSGDLVQLSHIALGLTGGGKIWHKGQYYPAGQIFKKFNLKPYSFEAKEGLSVINGTSMMSGIASVVLMKTQKLLNLSIESGAWALELVSAFEDGLDPALHNARPHLGQKYIAQRLRMALKGSRLLKNRENLFKKNNGPKSVVKIDKSVQEIYSFRCMPQILGPISDDLAYVQKIIETEINSSTDNPLIDISRKKVLHGGNFHGEYIASGMDQIKASLIKLTMLWERRINFFLNHNLNKSFPPFLNLKQPGLTLGLQGLQFVATSTTAHSQSLGFPHRLHSIPTNADNQDIVSMGADAALFADKVAENAFILLTIQLVVLAQATDSLNITSRLCASSKNLYKLVRENFPVLIDDRQSWEQLENLRKKIKQF